MADVRIDDKHLTDIANAIRSKNGTSINYKPREMANAIQNLAADTLIDRSITSVNSDVAKVGKYAFAYCSELTEVNFPQATTIEMQAFSGCSSLAQVNLPKVETLENQVFSACPALTKVTLPSAKTLKTAVFMSCTNLTAVILPNTTAATMATGNPFSYSNNVYLYVPSALVSTYQGYSNIMNGIGSARVRAIEDYPEICG